MPQVPKLPVYKPEKEKPEPKPKRVRAPKQEPPKETAPPPSPAPNPTVLALQAQIVPLVERREEAQQSLSRYQFELSAAQVKMNQAQQDLARIEGAIQYRLNLIRQIEPGAVSPSPSMVNFVDAYPSLSDVAAKQAAYEQHQYSGVNDFIHGMGATVPDGVSSIPAPRQASPSAPRGVRSESAESLREHEVRAGY